MTVHRLLVLLLRGPSFDYPESYCVCIFVGLFVLLQIMGHDRLKTHVTGVIAHGPHDQKFTFLDKAEFPHDSNMTMNVVLKVLWHLSSKVNLF